MMAGFHHLCVTGGKEDTFMVWGILTHVPVLEHLQFLEGWSLELSHNISMQMPLCSAERTGTILNFSKTLHLL